MDAGAGLVTKTPQPLGDSGRNRCGVGVRRAGSGFELAKAPTETCQSGASPGCDVTRLPRVLAYIVELRLRRGDQLPAIRHQNTQRMPPRGAWIVCLSVNIALADGRPHERLGVHGAGPRAMREVDEGSGKIDERNRLVDPRHWNAGPCEGQRHAQRGIVGKHAVRLFAVVPESFSVI